MRRRDVSTQPLQRWEPFRELEELHERMGQLMDNVCSGAGLDGHTWSPCVDFEETEDAWIVEAEIPGVKRKDVTVELRDAELHREDRGDSPTAS